MSPKTQQQFEGMREEKKALIMGTALRLFANMGYHSTTIKDIAKYAGISKGLMYNYFKSKEDLLTEIISKSIDELYNSFDINRDGYLTEDEFEFFIRKISRILYEKHDFWRLFFQVLMQTEVREQFLNRFLGTESPFRLAKEYKEGSFISGIMKTIADYFTRKQQSRKDNYDPWLEMNMFILTIKGFAITYVFMEPGKDDDEYFAKTVDHIISLYK